MITGETSGRRWAGALLAVAFTTWLVFPFLSLDGWLFSSELSGDYLRGAWLYDFTARFLAEHHRLPWWFTDWGWPQPISRQTTLPNVVDAAMAAPLNWVFGWPKSHALTMALAVAWSAMGLAWLARAAGCGWGGIAVAGCLGGALWPVWREMYIGRMNDAWIGVSFAALAAFLDLARAAAPPMQADAGGAADAARSRRWLRWGAMLTLRAGLAAGLGAMALSIYPPYPAMLGAPGAVLLLPHLRRHPVTTLLAVGVAGAAGLALAWPEVTMMGARSSLHKAPCTAGGCPKELWYVTGISILGLKAAPQWLWMPATGVALGSWILAPLAFVSGRRWRTAALLALVAGSIYLATGSCFTLRPPPPGAALPWREVGAFQAWLWCFLEPIHDYGRFLMVGAGLTALLSAVAVDGLMARGRLGLAMGVLLGAAAVAHSSWVLREGTFSQEHWHEVGVPVTARFLQSAEPGPAAEIPWDESAQYLSLLAAPASPRINPVQPDFHPESKRPFIQWMHRLSRGYIPEERPSRADIAASEVRWVFHDPRRCGHTGRAPLPACGARAIAALEGALGPGQLLEEGVRVWDLAALPPEEPAESP